MAGSSHERDQSIVAENNKEAIKEFGATFYHSEHILKPEEVISALLKVKKILKENSSKINEKFDIYYSVNFDEILDDNSVDGEHLYNHGTIKSAARKNNVYFGSERFIYLDGVKKIVSGENKFYLKGILGKKTDLRNLKEMKCKLLKNEFSSLRWIKPKIGKEAVLKIEKYSESVQEYIDCIDKLIKTCELAKKECLLRGLL